MTRLREARDDDLALLERWRATADSEYEEWRGELPHGGPPPAPALDPGELVVIDGSGAPVGLVSWHTVVHGPNAGSAARNIGISLRAPARGHGHGSRAQGLLAAHLFTTTSTHRVEASTDVRNVAEQRALEHAGFTREGVLRGAQWRRGTWHDLVGYARLRDDPPGRDGR